jgi:hypothetical protein
MNKNIFLAVYDYDTGGVWRLVRACSKDEIRSKYTRLDIVEDSASPLSEDSYKRLEKKIFDIDDPPDEFFLSLLDPRN